MIERGDGGRFKPGSGGRPVGARNRLQADFLKALQDDFNTHGAEVIKYVRAENAVQYLKIIASCLPKEFIVSDSALEDLSDDELAQALAEIRALRSANVESMN